MDKANFAKLIDAYADAKVSGNEILVRTMVGKLESALNSFYPGEPVSIPDELSLEEKEEAETT